MRWFRKMCFFCRERPRQAIYNNRMHDRWIAAYNRSGNAARLELSAVVQQELACSFFDHPRWHQTEMLHVSVYERVFAEEIYDAGNPLRIKVHDVHYIRSKDRVSHGAADTQPLCDVTVGLFKSEWCSPASERNSLPELPKFRPFELVFKLRLANQHDLQQLFGGSLQI